MASTTYATSSPAATTGGQGNNPVSTPSSTPSHVVYICNCVFHAAILLFRVVLFFPYQQSWHHTAIGPIIALPILSTQQSSSLSAPTPTQPPHLPSPHSFFHFPVFSPK
ncbi:hypothetical protein BDV10DRAFT_46636 [Aspergillus recurvatus]